LTAGGVGGEGLKQRLGLKSALESPDLFGKMEYGPDKAEKGGKAPVQDLDADAVRLRDDLVKATPVRQTTLVDEMRDAKGVAFTQALAAAIPKLEGDVRKKAREALAERLARMTSATLGDKLRDDDLEVRRAAALACAMKEDRTHVERLILLLDDPEPPVQRAAYAALKSLSGEDHGPAADASRAERTKAMAAWQGWWLKQKK
jgi:HEAT repeat protein